MNSLYTTHSLIPDSKHSTTSSKTLAFIFWCLQVLLMCLWMSYLNLIKWMFTASFFRSLPFKQAPKMNSFVSNNFKHKHCQRQLVCFIFFRLSKAFKHCVHEIKCISKRRLLSIDWANAANDRLIVSCIRNGFMTRFFGGIEKCT